MMYSGVSVAGGAVAWDVVWLVGWEVKLYGCGSDVVVIWLWEGMQVTWKGWM